MKRPLKLYLILAGVGAVVCGSLALESYLVFLHSDGWQGILKYQSWKFVIAAGLFVWLCRGGHRAPMVSAVALLAWSVPLLGLSLAALFVLPGTGLVLAAPTIAPFIAAIVLLRSSTIKAHAASAVRAQQGIQPDGPAPSGSAG